MRIQQLCKRCNESIDMEVEPQNVFQKFAGGTMVKMGDYSVKCPGCGHVYLVTRQIPDKDQPSEKT